MNPRSAQLLAAALAALLIVLLGATIFVLLNQPAGPTPAPSPTEVAMGSPSPSPFASESPSPSLATASPSPTASASPEPTLTPSPEPPPTEPPTPSPSPSPSASPSPSPSPSPAPTVNPTSPQHEIRLIALGLDSRDAETGIGRIVTFDVDGQSLVGARISDASAGGIRLCLWREAAIDERRCETGRNVGVQRAVTDTGQTRWHVSMIGTQQASPHVTLTLRFNANGPAVLLGNIRWAGTSFPEYNGYEAVVQVVNDGNLRIEASIDDGEGGAYPFDLRVVRVSDGQVVREESGEAESLQVVVEGVEPGAYRISLRSPEEQPADGERAVFVTSEIRWP